MDLSVLDELLFVGTLFRHKRDMNTTQHVLLPSLDDMFEWLSRCHSLSYRGKHDNLLISPTLFNPTLGDKFRGRDNAVISWGIWLDIDDGDMPYPVFHKMFSGIRMVIYNTASSTNDTRYRVFIPTTGYMMADTYHAICEQIVRVVQMNGYCSPRQKKRGSKKPCHGIDPTKLAVENMMYLPCRPMDGSDGFFEVYEGVLLDPGLWVQNSILPVNVPPPMFLRAAPQTESVVSNMDAAKVFEGLISAIFDASTGRNNNLYQAAKHGIAMADAGLLDAWDVENRLEQTAYQAGLEKSEIRPSINSGRRNSRKITRYRHAV